MTKLYHHALKAGTTIANFTITRILGVGGFGITYQAYDEDLERDVAIKEYFPSSLALRGDDGLTIAPRGEDDAENYAYGLNQFLAEAKTLAKFNQPNIVRVTQFLKLNNTAYLIMNYEEGESLSLRLKKQVTLDERQLMEIIMALLEGLQAVHAKQFLHRDIKPANIFICHDERPVLLDFGSARLAVQDREMTAIVTPGYAPQEQYYKKHAQGAWTDLYAIGATMFHCITGVKPYPALDRANKLRAGEDPIRQTLEEANDSCSKATIDYVLRLMEPDATNRPQTAELALAECRQVWDELVAGDTEEITWDADFLEAVEKVLVDKHVSHAHELLEQAQKNAHSVREMANRLAENIDTDKDKMEFLEKTVLLARPPAADEHSYTDETSVLPLYEVLRHTQTLLATIIGPEAKSRVTAVARKAETRVDFYRQLIEQLTEEEHRQEFIAGVKMFDKQVVL